MMSRNGWALPVLVCLGLVGVTAATYWPVLTCSFVNYDDIEYVFKYHTQVPIFAWSGWKFACTSFICCNWHPLTILSLAFDDYVWGFEAQGYHLTNLLFHCANVALVFLVLEQMTHQRVPSICVAALFGLHPLHVESVAWISERKDVLSTFFLLLTMVAYVGYASRPTLLRYISVFVLMALGLLAKPMLVTLPVLLLLVDGWPLGRLKSGYPSGCNSRFPSQSLTWLLIEKIPLLCLSLGDGLMTIVAQGNAKAQLKNLTLDARFANACYAYYWYLEKTFLPINLIAYYPHSLGAYTWSSVAVGVGALSFVTFIALWQLKSRPYLAFGWFWFLISLLPVIGIMQVGSQAYADRYAYVPHIGLFVAIVWELYSWVGQSKVARIASGTGCILVLAIFAALSHQQVYYWQSSETLWNHALDVKPENAVALIGLSDYKVANKKYEEAIDLLERAMKVNYQDPADAFFSWGCCLAKLDRPEEAEAKFLETLKWNPDHEAALQALCELLLKEKRFADAAAISTRYERSFSNRKNVSPNDYRVDVNLGLTAIREGNLKQAIVHFERATQRAPYSAASFNNLANAQLQLGLLKDARENFVKSLTLNPKLNGAHFNLAAILEQEGDLEGARQHYAEAFQIDSNDLEAKQNMERLSKP